MAPDFTSWASQENDTVSDGDIFELNSTEDQQTEHIVVVD